MIESAYPYAATRAARVLQEALAKATSKNPGGLRALAARLEMKQAVNLSRMASGRMPIPLERVAELAVVLDLNPTELSMAVIEQRAPSVHAILAEAFELGGEGAIGPIPSKLRRMMSVAHPVSEEQVEIASEVFADRKPSERWLKITEVPVIRMIREVYPDGPTISDLELLKSALEVQDAARSIDP